VSEQDTSTEDAQRPTKRATATPPRAAGDAVRRVAKWTVAAASAALISWGVTIVVPAAWHSVAGKRAAPLTLSQQLEHVREAASVGRARIVYETTAPLRNQEEVAHVMIIRHYTKEEAAHPTPEEEEATAKEPIPPSDEIRIYDENHPSEGRPQLRLDFHFQPGHLSTGDALYFDVRSIEPISGGSQQVIIGDFRPLRGDNPLPYPVVLRWDSAKRQYRIYSLIPEAPPLPHLRDAGEYAEGANKSFYSHAETIADPSTGVSLIDYETPYFRVTGGHPPALPVITNVYIVKGPRYTPTNYAVVSRAFDLTGLEPQSYECGEPEIVRAPPGEVYRSMEQVARTVVC
jgi:hypothetical protein